MEKKKRSKDYVWTASEVLLLFALTLEYRVFACVFSKIFIHSSVYPALVVGLGAVQHTLYSGTFGRSL